MAPDHAPAVDPVDPVFRALDDPNRRLLLDQLLVEDGQTLSELCRHLSTMTRHGVMNHLGVLEAAGLVTTAKIGRQKHHYLNPVPIRLVTDRWLNRFTAASVGTIAGLKHHLEQGAPMADDATKPCHIHETFIAAAPERVWQALTNPTDTVRYFYGTKVDSTWQVGESIRYVYGPGEREGELTADGVVLAIDEPHRLELTFHARWDPELEAEGPVRMVWLVEAGDGGVTHVRVEYYDIPAAGPTMAAFVPGIAHVVAGMKTLLETGAPMGATAG